MKLQQILRQGDRASEQANNAWPCANYFCLFIVLQMQAGFE